jgi:hypothetical protein
VASCSSLTGMNFSRVPAAPGKVTSATAESVKLGSKMVSFCKASGVFFPHTGFSIMLPTATWHGQYVQEGCSTLCGNVRLIGYPLASFLCDTVDNGQLVLATDDAHGGKLTMYHGWADQSISPWSTLDYYAAGMHPMIMRATRVPDTPAPPGPAHPGVPLSGY